MGPNKSELAIGRLQQQIRDAQALPMDWVPNLGSIGVRLQSRFSRMDHPVHQILLMRATWRSCWSLGMRGHGHFPEVQQIGRVLVFWEIYALYLGRLSMLLQNASEWQTTHDLAGLFVC